MVSRKESRTISTLYNLKPRFQRSLQPVVARLARQGVTANQVTLVAVCCSVAFGVVLAIGIDIPALLLLLPLFLFLRMTFNAMDGMLAREHGQASRLGAILNEITDAVSDAALYLPFALLPQANPILVVVAVVLALVSEMTGVVAQATGGSRRYDGPLGKSDRALVFGALGLVIGLGVAPGAWFDVVMFAVVVMSIATIVQRARLALGEDS